MWIGEASAFTPVFTSLQCVPEHLQKCFGRLDPVSPSLQSMCFECICTCFVLRHYLITTKTRVVKKRGAYFLLSYTALSCKVRSFSFFNGHARTRALSVRNMAASSWNTAARPNERYPAAAPLSQRHLPDQTAPVYSGNSSSSGSSRAGSLPR